MKRFQNYKLNKLLIYFVSVVFNYLSETAAVKIFHEYPVLLFKNKSLFVVDDVLMLASKHQSDLVPDTLELFLSSAFEDVFKGKKFTLRHFEKLFISHIS